MKLLCFFNLLAALLFVYPCGLEAQQNTFSRVFINPGSWNEAQAYSVAETDDSAFIIVGSRDEEALILKMGQSGEMLWDKRVDFGFSSPVLYRIIPTADHAFAIAGTGGSNLICLKITPGGDTVWSRAIDFGNYEYVTHIEQTSDLGFILCGYSVFPPVIPHRWW